MEFCKKINFFEEIFKNSNFLVKNCVFVNKGVEFKKQISSKLERCFSAL